MCVLLGVTLLGACREDALNVTNPNQPDIALAFKDAINVEAVTGKLFQQMFNGQYAVAGDAIWAQGMVLAFESSSQLGNFGMGTRSIIPRPTIDNSIGNAVAAGNFRDYDFLTRNVRGAANAIVALNAFIAADAGTGSPARDARAKSFAYFSMGYGLGHLSLIYDSAAVITAAAPATEALPYSDYRVVNQAALQALDSAIAIANSANATSGSGGWPIPKEWWLMSGTASAGPDRATWIRILRSYRAKFAAGVARTATERAAVNWNTVIADATNGIVEDLSIQSDQQAGWFMTTLNQLAISASWSQMTPFILGMADTTGAYETWLATSVLSRTGFLMRTPDQRFPSGETRAEQTANSGGSTRNGPPAGTVMYFRNRPPGEDASNFPWGAWQYDNHRFWLIRAAGGNGTWILMSRTESDMLAAEGYIRTGQVALAIPLINRTRTRAGLPAIPVSNDVNAVVPGGNACVPQVPQPPNFTTTACGNIMEAMKWEKRVETNMTGHIQWFIDSRGWGDLYAGTPLEWPVPYQELFAQYGSERTPNTNTRVAPVGTYGFGRSSTF
jgi:hypothetical protein